MSTLLETAKAVSGLSSEMSAAKYLFTRLKELGCCTVFGVPGDFNMGLLDVIEDMDGMKWGANTNELNAGYAADGYARVKGLGAVCTTFGVGELSCINAIAGSYAEMVPVVHIVGVPATSLQHQKAMLHHSLGNGDFNVFMRMNKDITVAQSALTLDNTTEEVDRCLTECLLKKRPVYIAIPTDIASRAVKATMKPLLIRQPENPKNEEEACLRQILSELASAKNASILIDGCCSRFHIEAEVLRFAEKVGLPIYAAPMGKAVVSDLHPHFRGTYIGNLTPPEVRKEVEESDLIIMIGSIKSDFNTGGFTFNVMKEKLIELHSSYTKIYHATYESVGFHGLLPKLTQQAKAKPYVSPPSSVIKAESNPSADVIAQKFFWSELGKCLSQQPHIVCVETGTSSFGTSSQKLATGSQYISQVLYGSIGFATAAAVGAALAGGELESPLRVVLVTGDGSFQLTATDVATFMRHKLHPILIVINNDGYTIERFIHGEQRKYNDIVQWDYSNSLNYFARPILGDSVSKRGLQLRLSDPANVASTLEKAFADVDAIHILEVVTARMDAPETMIGVAAAAARMNKY